MVTPTNPTFPGRGGTPLEPQAFYVQDVVGVTPDYGKLFRGFLPTLPVHYYSYPRLPDYSWTWGTSLSLKFQPPGQPLPGAMFFDLPPAYLVPPPIQQFWQIPNFILPRYDTNRQSRGVLRSLPDQPATQPLHQPPFQSWPLLRGIIQAPFRQTDWPLPQQPWRLDQTWTQSYNLSLIGKDTMLAGEQVYSLAPGQVAPDQIQLRSWQWSYNLSLIGKDRLPTGEQVYILAPSQVLPEQIQLHSWSWSYNLNLIGKDAIPTGEQRFDLAPIYQPYINQLRTWSWQYNLTLIGQDRLPVGLEIWELAPRAAPPIFQSWTWQYNLNLIGKDQMVAGEQRYELVPAQVPPEQTQLHSWQWWYNLNLIGQDRSLVGKQVWERPTLPVPPALTWTDPTKIWLTAPTINISISQYWERPQLVVPPAQTWSWSYNLNLIGQDRMATGVQVYDLAPIYPPYISQLRTWSWQYNLSLIGKDRLPTGQQVWERPTLGIPPAVTWVEGPQYELIAKPFGPYDWPNPIQPYRIDQTWAWQYNLNLIGQDRMATGQQVTDLPPRDFARLFQTWIQQVNLALYVTPPVLDITKQQRDWPVPRGVEPDWRRGWTAGYNLDLIGQDQLPFRQQDWPNPTQPSKIDPTWAASYNKNLIGQDRLPFRQQDWPLTPAPQQAAQTWIDQTKILLTAVQRPFVQSDWPVPQPPQGAIQTWINTVSLALNASLGKPFAQTDWPNPTQPARDPTLSTVAAGYNLNLIGQDRLPNRQQDWPLPAAHALSQIPLQIMVAGKPFFLVPPTPLPPGAQFYVRPELRPGTAADLAWPAWRWPQITPPPVTGVIPLRTLMGTGL